MSRETRELYLERLRAAIDRAIAEDESLWVPPDDGTISVYVDPPTFQKRVIVGVYERDAAKRKAHRQERDRLLYGEGGS